MAKLKAHSEQYHLDIKFGSDKSSTTRLSKFYNPIDEMYIIQDINRFLPTFRLKIQDVGGYYSNLFPYDKKQNKINVTFNRDRDIEGAANFDFDVYRRFPSSDFLYDIEGVLQINNFFKPSKIRGFSGLISDTLSTIADELGATSTDISPSLKYEKKIIQTYQSNSELLQYLRDNLLGTQNTAPYFCYITYKDLGQGIEKVFVFKSLDEFYKQKVKYTFSDSPTAVYDKKFKIIYYPILDFKAYDNYKLLETSGSQKLDYSHFNYTTDLYEMNSVDVDDYYSLTRYFSINQDNTEDNSGSLNVGRSNDFSSDFQGKSKGMFYKKINDLSKFWITTWGLEDIYPGDIVRLQFFENTLNMLSYQYHGFWMVERIVHTLGQAFGTRLLLTRNGVNTIEDTMLKEATNRKK